MLVINNVAEGGVFTMSGTLTGAKIGAIMISKEDGDLIKPRLDGSLGSTADGTMRKPASVATPARDSDFDAGVIVHEYGHGVSVRLTGGPGNSACLDNAEQAGEEARPVLEPTINLYDGTTAAVRFRDYAITRLCDETSGLHHAIMRRAVVHRAGTMRSPTGGTSPRPRSVTVAPQASAHRPR